MAETSTFGRTGLGGPTLGGLVFRTGVVLAIVGAIGLLMGLVVQSPNKRLIEAFGGAVFLMVAMVVHMSYSLGVMLALLPFPAGLSFATSNEVLIVMLGVVWSVRQMIRGEPVLKRTPIDAPVLILIAGTLISLFRHEGPTGGLEAHLRAFFTSFILFYLIVSSCTTREQFQRLLVGFSVAILGATIIAVIQMFYPGRTLIPEFIYVPEEVRWDKFVRAAGTFGNYSVFGQFMALSMILVSYLFLRTRSLYAKLMSLAILLGVVATFMSAAMRGALLALGVGLVYMAVIGRREVKMHQWLAMLVILGLALLALGGVMVTYLDTGYLLERFEGFSLERGSPTSRMATNLYFLEESLKRPLFGHGPVIELSLDIAGAMTNNPHCQYLYLFYTLGLVGLGAFLWMLVRLYAYSLKAIRTRRSEDMWICGLLVVFHTMLVVFALHELIDDYMTVRLYQHIVWGMFGILVVLSRLVLEGPAPEPAPVFPERPSGSGELPHA